MFRTTLCSSSGGQIVLIQHLYVTVRCATCTPDGHLQRSNRACLSCIKIFKSKPVSRHIKLKIRKTLIRPIVTYWSQAWTSTAKEVNVLRIFERKTVRKMCGPVTEA